MAKSNVFKHLNVNDLRGILSEEIQKLRRGKTTAANVNACTNATGKILATVKIQMEYCKMTGKTADLDMVLSQPKRQALPIPAQKHK